MSCFLGSGIFVENRGLFDFAWNVAKQIAISAQQSSGLTSDSDGVLSQNMSVEELYLFILQQIYCQSEPMALLCMLSFSSKYVIVKSLWSS